MRTDDTTGDLTTVKALLKAYSTGDFDTFINLLADRVEYNLYLDESVVPFAGATEGKFDFIARLADMHRQFEYILYRPSPPREKPDGYHVKVEFIYRHRASGELLEGHFRLVIRVANGRAFQIHEFHDAERVKAFFRLVESGKRA